MGINPNAGDGVEKNYTVDGRTDATSIVSDAERTGQEAGKVFAHIAAQADSANNGMSELSNRVKVLEGKATVTRDGSGRVQSADPAAPNDVATKRYVDQSIEKAKPPEIKTQQQAGKNAAVNWRRWGNVVAVTATRMVDVSALRTEPVPAWAIPDQLQGVTAVGSTSGTAVFVRDNGSFTVTGPDAQVRFTLTYIVL